MDRLVVRRVVAAFALLVGYCAGEGLAAESSNPFGLPGEWATIVRREDVVKELGLSPKQIELLQPILDAKAEPDAEAFPDVATGNEESRKRIGDVLDREQLERLRRRSWQVSGGFALFEPAVAEQLALSSEQKAALADVAKQAYLEMKDFLSRARFASREAMEKFQTEACENAGRQLLERLDAGQRKKFDSLLPK